MKVLFLDLEPLGEWLVPHATDLSWQDMGLALLVTLGRQAGHQVDVLSTRNLRYWGELLRGRLDGYEAVAMNVRTWRFPLAVRAAAIIKARFPQCQVWAGGFHASIAPDELLAHPTFDVICTGQGEESFLRLLADGGSSERLIHGGEGPYTNLDDLPWIDRAVWPVPAVGGQCWPYEMPSGWSDGGPTVSMLTSRACPFKCRFCWPNEITHYGRRRRRSVGNVLGELNAAEQRWGPFGSVVFHDSLFFLEPKWLEEFATRYPAETRAWPFWMAARVDTLLRWPDTFRRLAWDCNLRAVSVGFESGSDRVLEIVGKGITVEQNVAAIAMINQVGDEMEAAGRRPPYMYANLLLAVPGEEPADVFASLRMFGQARRTLPAMSFFTPYPGCDMAKQLEAEGKVLARDPSFYWGPDLPRVKGVDYEFYQRLVRGEFDKEIGVPIKRFLVEPRLSGIRQEEGAR